MTAIDLTQLVDLDKLDAELEELSFLAHQIEVQKRRYDELRELIGLQVAALGQEKLEHFLGTFVGTHRTTVKVENPKTLPRHLLKEVPDNDKIKKLAAQGKEIPGVSIEENLVWTFRRKAQEDAINEFTI